MSPSPTRLDVLPGGHSMRDFALAYGQAGYPVLPLRGKAPYIRRGFHNASTDLNQIRQWWTQWPRAGIGIRTGSCTGLWVLDVDVRDGKEGPAVLEALRFVEGGGPLRATVARSGSGGHHYYFSLPAGRRISTVGDKLGPGLDVRGETGHVVAPPSAHESGTPYRWMEESLLDSPPPVAPGWLLSALSAPSPKARSRTPSPGRGINIGTTSLSTSGGTVIPLISLPREEEGESGSGSDLLRWEGQVDEKGAKNAHGAWGRDQAAVQRVLDHWGVDAAPGEAFRCVLPGHAERNPSASLWPSNETGVWRYHDWHGREGQQWWSLAEVHASRHSGQLVRFGEGFPLGLASEARWWLRLWHDVGLLPVQPVALPLGLGATDLERKLAQGFGLLLALRHTCENGPIPFTRRFAVTWCAVSDWHARKGIESLLRHRVICKDDEHETPEGRKLYLYLPGPQVRELPELQRSTPRKGAGRTGRVT